MDSETRDAFSSSNSVDFWPDENEPGKQERGQPEM